MTITQTGIEITQRFFMAIDKLKEDGKIRGMQTFTRKHDINRWNLVSVKNNPHNTMLKCEYIAMLCEDFNVSAKWILLGKGDFYDSVQN